MICVSYRSLSHVGFSVGLGLGPVLDLGLGLGFDVGLLLGLVWVLIFFLVFVSGQFCSWFGLNLILPGYYIDHIICYCHGFGSDSRSDLVLVMTSFKKHMLINYDIVFFVIILKMDYDSA